MKLVAYGYLLIHFLNKNLTVQTTFVSGNVSNQKLALIIVGNAIRI